eukprot:354316-Chlamydomonas_euryale.AAC.4
MVGPAVTREHLWLLRLPAATANVHVWRVTGVAALNAMDASRRYMWAEHRAHPTPGLTPGQTVLWFASVGPAPTGVRGGGPAGGGCPPRQSGQLRACARCAPR